MEFKQLEAFVAVAQYKSFSQAAKALYLSQPTISTYILALEKELDVKLVERTTKRVHLTKSGIHFLQYANRILELQQTAHLSLGKGRQKFLRIGVSTIPSVYLLPYILPGFHRENREVRYEVRQGDSSDIIDLVMGGHLDIALVGKSIQHNDYYCESFCSDELVFTMPNTAYYKRILESENPALALLKEPFILREDGSGTMSAALELLDHDEAGTESLHIVAQMNDPKSIKQLVLAGMGISIFSRRSLISYENKKQLLTYSLGNASSKRYFYIFCSKEKKEEREIADLIAYIMQHPVPFPSESEKRKNRTTQNGDYRV